MSETFDRWTDNRNEHEAGLMDPGPHYRGNEPSASQIDYERQDDDWMPELCYGKCDLCPWFKRKYCGRAK
jgi:hypothetical protein